MIVLAAACVPGSGHVLLGKPFRGLLFVLWIFLFGFITAQLAGPSISIVGRWSGGLAVWLLSILEVMRMTRWRSR
ncbi:MAG: hypothetical protein ABSH53_18320 [Holophaga sp.]